MLDLSSARAGVLIASPNAARSAAGVRSTAEAEATTRPWAASARRSTGRSTRPRPSVCAG